MKNIKNIIEQKYPPENPNDLWMKDNVLYKSTHKGWTPLTAGGGSSTNGVTSTTWLELKDKRDAGKLIPGSLYRITDYNCTTTQENTQSAGHQFDIVLLALSENKLAEEGWAMEHPTDVYDVTFADGVVKKCYIYLVDVDGGKNVYNVVDVETKLGIDYIAVDQLDEENKTASVVDAGYDSTDLTTENLTYNYFQNSNLSAWKVWYCLDNDKSRFAWADDSVDDKAIISFEVEGVGKVTIPRKESEDVVVAETQCYAWGYPDVNTAYTTSEQPVIGDKVFQIGDKVFQLEEGLVEFSTIESVSEPTGLSNGRGVIYRLIDEWNNDVPYDFKNILYLRKLTDGEIDAQGTDTYIPTFCLYDMGNAEYRDASIFAINYKDDEGNARPCFNNFIDSIIAINHNIDEGTCALPLTVFLTKVENNDTGYGVYNNTVYTAFNCNITNNTSNIIILYSSNKTYYGFVGVIIRDNSCVVWESMS